MRCAIRATVCSERWADSRNQLADSLVHYVAPHVLISQDTGSTLMLIAHLNLCLSMCSLLRGASMTQPTKMRYADGVAQLT
jgi:hypothetical protein